MSSELKTRELIIEIFHENPKWTFKHIARKSKVCRETVSKVIKKFHKDLTVGRKHGSGAKKGIRNQKTATKVTSLFKKDPGLSTRKVAQKAGCSKTFVERVKKQKQLRTYKVQKVPDRNAVKNEEAKKRAQKLKRDFFSKFHCCVMDDESYVLADFKQLPGQEFYVADSRGNVDEEFRTMKQAKFPKKFLIWQAICSCGERSEFFVASGTINSEIYQKECLQKRLLPFLRNHKVSTFFWPDLASCHYSKATLEWYKRNQVNFVPREANPPNCPELRPIERYWAMVKRKLKDTKHVTRNPAEFKRKWTTVQKNVKKDTIKDMMEGIPEKLQNFFKK